MRFYDKVTLSAAALSVAVLAIAADAYSNQPAPPPDAMSTVRIDLKDAGHGSGVSIGKGFMLSAAHVVEDNKTVSILTSDKRNGSADVLWVNKLYDIALLRINGNLSNQIQSSPLNCDPLTIGQPLTSVGNPTVMDFLKTKGRVSGAPRAFSDWAVVVPVDMTIIQGMSGGPALNDRGEVAGINIGILTAPTIDYSSESVSGIGVVVPSTAICELLAR